MIKGTAVLEPTYKLALVPKFSSVRTESSARLQQGTPTATSTAASRPLRRSCRALRASATTPSPLAVPARAAAQRTAPYARTATTPSLLRTAPYARTATTPSPLMRPTRVRDHSVASCRTSACGISACRTAFASTSMRAPRAAPTPVRPEHPPGSPQHRPRAHGKQIPCAAHDYCAMDRAQRQSAE